MSQPQTSPIDPKSVSLLWAGAENAQEISRMHGETQRDHWSEDSVHELLINPYSSALVVKIRLVAKNPPVAAGYVMGQIAGDEVEILSVGVLAPFQRFGLGRRLVEGLTRAAKRAEAERMYLEVGVDNPPAIAFYDALGFGEAGRRERYYKNADGTSTDALIMVRDI